jgi:hypothetical protein
MKQFAYFLKHFLAWFFCSIDQCAICGEQCLNSNMTLQNNAFRVCKNHACEERYLRLTA